MGLRDDRSEDGFQDYKSALSAHQAVVEANRCLFCHDAPCIQACPTSIDIPSFIRKIATGNVKGSAKTILESNVLGMSCARVCPVEVLCVGDCVYNEMDAPPIQIGKLQRYATDLAYDEGWTFFTAGPDTGRSVGIVGGGPAGLAAAHRLRRFGHRATIYEKRDVLGGLNTTGVAPYKMRADRSIQEVERVLAIGGIEVRTGTAVPEDVGWDELLTRHDALFLGFGLGPDTILDLPGKELRGISGAVDWIERMKLGRVDVTGVRTAVVIGGGNTAVDVVRELLGLGVADVRMLYRGPEASMSGYAHEWSAAKEQGAHGVWHVQPVGYVSKGGSAPPGVPGSEGTDSVGGVRCVRTDDEKHPVPGSEHVIPADLVLLAVGQSKLSALVDRLGLTVHQGRIVTDASGATSRPGIWAGGDGQNGGREVVNAVAEGRDAAVSIHAWLGGL